MKYSKKCECCGHITTAYIQNLNTGKVKALRKLVDKYQIEKEPVSLGSLGISNSQYTNFCHLTYFGLAQHLKTGWVPTAKGISFIRGEIGVQHPVAVMASEVLPDWHEAWKTHQGGRSIMFVFDFDQDSYKKREEYAGEKMQEDTLF